jgi:hypothetical protein
MNRCEGSNELLYDIYSGYSAFYVYIVHDITWLIIESKNRITRLQDRQFSKILKILNWF